MKQYLETIRLAAALSLVTASMGNWLFFGYWLFLALPLMSGLILTAYQKHNRAYQFLGKLMVGSLVYGFLSVCLIDIVMYLTANFIYNSGMPFMPLYNPKDYLIFSLVFIFISLIGGLVGIVAKGFYIICNDKIYGS